MTRTYPFFDDEVFVGLDECLSLLGCAAHEQMLCARGQALGAHVLPQQLQRVVQRVAVDQVIPRLEQGQPGSAVLSGPVRTRI